MGQVQQKVLDLQSLLETNTSIPDHTDFSEDVKQKLKEIDEKRSLLETLSYYANLSRHDDPTMSELQEEKMEAV